MVKPDPEIQSFVDGKWAIVWCPENGFTLVTPPMEDEGEREVPETGLALTAIMVRLERDPDFLAEMAQWFKDEAKATN